MSVLLIAAAGLNVVLSAAAIVIRHDRDDERYLTLGRGFPAVCRIGSGGAGTLVAPEWVLTAAHVARRVRPGEDVVIRERRFPVREVVLHPGWSQPQTNRVDDIALLRLAQPVADVEPVPLYRRDDEAGRLVTFVGYGGTGDGQSGVSTFDRRLRAATNRIERADSRWLVFRFDAPGAGATELEGISGPGDSGGPAYLELDGTRYLAGVSSWQDNRAQAGRQGVYGVLEFYARVSIYADWIDATVGRSPVQ